ncbi:MAG: hypothetical protein K2J37_00765 [Ruminococcus sp.]|nr:hypothetical protein [Ruminococcus sp.]MDE6784486.1 hypothetical protein [Ruminococcus sp.]
MKILNIHGYKGSVENSACLVLKEMGFDVISPQIDYDTESFENILDNLRKIFTENMPDYIVGTSLGGAFALLVSAENSVPVILVNPCLMPEITLPELGYNGYISLVNFFNDFSADPEKTYAIIGGQDEVINYHENVTMKIIRNCTVIPDGKHSGATLPLKEFFGELIK